MRWAQMSVQMPLVHHVPCALVVVVVADVWARAITLRTLVFATVDTRCESVPVHVIQFVWVLSLWPGLSANHSANNSICIEK